MLDGHHQRRRAAPIASATRAGQRRCRHAASLAVPLQRQLEHEIGHRFGFGEAGCSRAHGRGRRRRPRHLLTEEHERCAPSPPNWQPAGRWLAAGTLPRTARHAVQRVASELVERQVAHIRRETMALLPLLDDLLDERPIASSPSPTRSTPERRPPHPAHPREPPEPAAMSTPAVAAATVQIRASARPEGLDAVVAIDAAIEGRTRRDYHRAPVAQRRSSHCCACAVRGHAGRSIGRPPARPAHQRRSFGHRAPALHASSSWPAPEHSRRGVGRAALRCPAALGRPPWRERDPHAVELDAQRYARLAGRPGLRAGAQPGARERRRREPSYADPRPACPSTPAEGQGTKGRLGATKATTKERHARATAATFAP